MRAVLGIPAFTSFRGVKSTSGEDELMGFPRYREPRFVGEIGDELLGLEYDPMQRRRDREAGSYRQTRKRSVEDERSSRRAASSEGNMDDEHRDDAGRESAFEAEARAPQPGLVAELLHFLMTNKKWWLTPIIIVLMLVALLIVLSGTAAAPFIYTLF